MVSYLSTYMSLPSEKLVDSGMIRDCQSVKASVGDSSRRPGTTMVAC